ncbi:MAG: hypothetical protein A3H14_01065 [Candidatus Doudnabacteria bacterium RIFCSPLOWO2_12_FULL_49_8]|nr:MAG: hypothetical protein A3H14_01065 [Candidatus Doudnabacteria bacterium RIFCSPLOWO2_12_FULL_49_8]
MTEHKQIPIVIGLVRNDKNELLIAKRSDPKFPEADNKWEFVGGKLEFGETPEQAVLREIEEESGLRAKVIRLLPKIFSNTWVSADGQESQVLLLCYECRAIGGALHRNEFDHKILDLKFVDPSALTGYDVMKAVPEIMDCLLSS